jgi:hypothetical protein
LTQEQVERPSEVQPLPLPSIQDDEPRIALGSQPGLPVPLIDANRTAAVKVEFGDFHLIIEQRGDEVAIVIPGALRLNAPRAQAMALVAALMKRP